MDRVCPEHSGIEQRLKSGDEKFVAITYTIEQFKVDMKAIADKFGQEARDMHAATERMNEAYREQMSDFMTAINTVINGDARLQIKGFEQRICIAESNASHARKGIAKIYKVGVAAGFVIVSIAGYFAKMFWFRMDEVMTAIEAINKLPK